MATANLTVTVPIQTGAAVGNVRTSITLQLAPAEAKALWKIRQAYVTATTQKANTGIDRTLRLLLQSVVSNGSYS